MSEPGLVGQSGRYLLATRAKQGPLVVQNLQRFGYGSHKCCRYSTQERLRTVNTGLTQKPT
jgi:hypothetical protein